MSLDSDIRKKIENGDHRAQQEKEVKSVKKPTTPPPKPPKKK